MKPTALILLLTSLIISGCNPGSLQQRRVDELETEVATLRRQMDSLLLAKALPADIKEPTPTGKSKTKKKTKAASSPSQSLYSTTESRAYTPPARTVTRKSSGYSAQCQALTKKGYQCSRTARSGGYCWQHGG